MAWSSVTLPAINVVPTLLTLTMTWSLTENFMLCNNWIMNMISFTASKSANHFAYELNSSCFTVTLIPMMLVQLKCKAENHLHSILSQDRLYYHCCWNRECPMSLLLSIAHMQLNSITNFHSMCLFCCCMLGMVYLNLTLISFCLRWLTNTLFSSVLQLTVLMVILYIAHRSFSNAIITAFMSIFLLKN